MCVVAGTRPLCIEHIVRIDNQVLIRLWLCLCMQTVFLPLCTCALDRHANRALKEDELWVSLFWVVRTLCAPRASKGPRCNRRQINVVTLVLMFEMHIITAMYYRGSLARFGCHKFFMPALGRAIRLAASLQKFSSLGRKCRATPLLSSTDLAETRNRKDPASKFLSQRPSRIFQERKMGYSKGVEQRCEHNHHKKWIVTKN